PARVEDDPLAGDESLHVAEEDVRVLLRMGSVEVEEPAAEEEHGDHGGGRPGPRSSPRSGPRSGLRSDLRSDRAAIRVHRGHRAGHASSPAVLLQEELAIASPEDGPQTVPRANPTMGIFKAYDIRGKVPSELDPALARRIGHAFVQLLSAKRLVVGRDMRSHSPA